MASTAPPMPPPAPSVSPLIVTDYKMVEGSPTIARRQAEVVWRRGRATDLGFNYTMNDGVTKLSLDQHLGRETRGEGTGGTVWDAAMVMGKYMEGNVGRFDSSKVIELGSGTGFASMVLLAIPEVNPVRLDVTDMQRCIPLMQSNFDRNVVEVSGLSTGNVQEYFWGNIPSDAGLPTDYTLIIASDVVYESCPVPLLVKSLSLLSQTNPRVEVLVSMEHRKHKAEIQFWELIERDGWVVETIHEDDMGVFKASDIDIYVLTKGDA